MTLLPSFYSTVTQVSSDVITVHSRCVSYPGHKVRAASSRECGGERAASSRGCGGGPHDESGGVTNNIVHKNLLKKYITVFI